MIEPIKLFPVETMENGTIRLQSQRSLGKDFTDFIIKDGELRVWRYGKEGVNFYPTDIPYIIVQDINEMKTQKL